MSYQKPQALAIPIDPEFAEVYSQAATQSASPEPMPRQSEPRTAPAVNQAPKTRDDVDDVFDGAEDLKRIALENQRNSIDRKSLQPGSFDQIENDVSNAIKVGWDWLTR